LLFRPSWFTTQILSILIKLFIFYYNNKECRIMIYARQVEVYWLEISRDFKRIFKNKKLFEKLVSIYCIDSINWCMHTWQFNLKFLKCNILITFSKIFWRNILINCKIGVTFSPTNIIFNETSPFNLWIHGSQNHHSTRKIVHLVELQRMSSSLSPHSLKK
jgi:hypothetical protein